jgi:pimeloyl-ACP methyl ester carboxylesterase
MAKPMQSVNARVQDTSFSYLVSGEGTPAFLLHGNPGTKQDMKALGEAMVKRAFRAIAIDRAGHGNSEEFPPEGRGNSWIDAEIYGELVRKLSGGKVILVGYSLGAFIALKIAARFPDQVAGIVLLSPFVIPRNPAESPSSLPELAMNRFLGTFLGLIVPLFAGGKIRQHLIDEMHPQTLSDTNLDEKVKRFGAFDKLVATLADKNLMLKSFADLDKELKKITAPILAIVGKQDKVCDQGVQWEKISKAFPNAERSEIAEGGHALPMTHAEKLAELIEDFCRRHPESLEVK